MFCKAREGLCSMVRQLNPRIHIESEAAIVQSIASFTNKIAVFSTSNNNTVEIVK
jgi:hypothetical protein